MQYMWTPWRMAYVSGAGDSGKEAGRVDDSMSNRDPKATPDTQHPAPDTPSCIFCSRIQLPESHDRESLIVLRARRNFVILNLYPYNTAHLMIVPYEHIADLPSLDPETASEMIELAQRMVRVIEEE